MKNEIEKIEPMPAPPGAEAETAENIKHMGFIMLEGDTVIEHVADEIIEAELEKLIKAFPDEVEKGLEYYVAAILHGRNSWN